MRNKLFTVLIFISCAVLSSIFIVALKTEFWIKMNILSVLLLFCELLFILGGIWFAYISTRKNSYIKRSIFLLGLVVLSVLPRLIWVTIVNTTPVSDFGHLYDYGVAASSGQFKSYVRFYEIFPFKFGYGFILAGLFKLFAPAVLVVKIFNVFLSVCIMLLVYLVSLHIFNEKSARISGFLIAIWPAQIMYSSVVQSELAFMVFFLLAVLLFVKNYYVYTGMRSIFWSLGAGTSLAAAQVIRPLSTLLIVIFAGYMIFFVRYNIPFKYVFIGKVKIMSFIIIGFILTIFILNWPVEKLTGVPLYKSSSGVNLMIGTNYKSSGMWNKEDFSILDKYNYNFDKVHSEATKIAFERIKSNPAQFLKLACKKFVIMWGDESYGRYWSLFEQNDTGNVKTYLKSKSYILSSAAQIFYLLVLLSAVAGCIYAQRKMIYTAAVPLMLLGGVFAAYIFLEVQSRYHFPVVPFLIFIAGYGAEQLFSVNIR